MSSADGKYSGSNWENLKLPIKMQLFAKPKTFCCNFNGKLRKTLVSHDFDCFCNRLSYFNDVNRFLMANTCVRACVSKMFV